MDVEKKEEAKIHHDGFDNNQGSAQSFECFCCLA
jgi:hypothetical protein